MGATLAAPTLLGAAARLLGDDVVDLTGAVPIVGIPAPPIVTRAQWGADESIRSGTPEFASLQKVTVHHTATGDEATDYAAHMRAIYETHVKSRGFQDIGYHFVVAPDGRIFEGRWAREYAPGETHSGEDGSGNLVVGAHASGHNPGNLGVAFIGTYTSKHPTAAAVESATQLISWVCDRHGLDPFDVGPYTNSSGAVVTIPAILGHRDVVSTSCPGDVLYSQIQDLRERVGATLANGFIGYRMVSSAGEAAHFGGARDYGDMRSVGVQTTVVGAAAIQDAQGYWLADRNGAVYSFGGAQFFGSLPGLRQAGYAIGNSPIIGIAPAASGNGYWLYDAVGGIFAFGDAQFFGSVPGLRNAGFAIGPARIASMVATPTGNGYWVLDESGGIFTFGDAQFFGSVPALRNAGVAIGPARTVSMAPTPSGNGYWVLDENGGIFAFGDAQFFGSVPGVGIVDPPARRIVASPSGNGYVIGTRSGAVYAFGDGPFHGRWVVPGLDAVDLVPVIRHR